MSVTFDELIEDFSKVVTVIQCDLFRHTGDYGMYVERNGLPYILLDENQSVQTKRMWLVEEFGHMMSTYGVILKQDTSDKIKQENKARSLAYKSLVTLPDLFHAYNHGITSEYEAAEELDVTQEFLHEAVEYFKQVSDEPIKMDNGYTAVIGETIEFYKTSDLDEAN